MSVWKQGKWYWSDFTIDGERYRLALDTTDRRVAVKKEKDLVAEVRGGLFKPGPKAPLARMPFEEACDRYLEQRKLDLEHPEHERNMAVSLRPFFREFRLSEITADSIRDYQAHRLTQGRHPNTVNHEVKMFFRVLKRAKLLSRIRDDVKLLPLKRAMREMLTAAEKQTLFERASTKPEWQTAYCAALLTANTTMRPVELKRLLWRDFDPVNRIVVVRRSKTEAGARVIPLNDEAWSALAALKQRADRLETYAPEKYILPRLWPRVDGTRPMGRTGWRKAWRNLTHAVECPKCGRLQQPADCCQDSQCKADMRGMNSPLASLRFYDLRHQCITEMLEQGVPEGVIRDVAGHVDPEMTRHYSHPRLEAKRAAVQALSVVQPAHAPQGYVIKHVIKALSTPDGDSQTTERIGRGARI